MGIRDLHELQLTQCSRHLFLYTTIPLYNRIEIKAILAVLCLFNYIEDDDVRKIEIDSHNITLRFMIYNYMNLLNTFPRYKYIHEIT